MPSLLIVVFILQLVIHLINTFGASTISELAWHLYNRLPTSTSATVKDTNRLRLQLIKLKQEMSSFSAQDQFARWAKLDRQHGKLKAEYEKKSSSLTTSRATFDSTFATARWLSTAGLRVFLQFWFSRKPIFYLPVGAAPVYVQWLLCFPRAPMGSVSIQAWGMACASVITLVSDALVAAWGLVNGVGRAQAASASARPQGVGVGIGAGAGGGAGEEKKEL